MMSVCSRKGWIAAHLNAGLALLGAATACSSTDSGAITFGDGSGANNGSSGSGSGSAGSGSTNSTGGNPPLNVGTAGGGNSGGGALGSAGASGNGTPEACDGLDNDGNGIIDDVDAGNDGICDCLNIATLGQIGPWSNGGNVFANWLNARSPLGAVALDDQILTESLLRPFQVIVALHVGTMAVTGNNRTAAAHHAFSDAEVDAFRAWVDAGGGAMSTIGYSGDEAKEVVNVNRLLAAVGMAYSTTDLALDGFVSDWSAHPVTMGVSSINTDNGVSPGNGGGSFAVGSGMRVALRVTEAGQGKAVVWGDEWITYDSEWRDVANQQVELFWVNILKWLSPPNRCQVPIPPAIIR